MLYPFWRRNCMGRRMGVFLTVHQSGTHVGMLRSVYETNRTHLFR